jgi:hypothetical protein
MIVELLQTLKNVDEPKKSTKIRIKLKETKTVNVHI